MQKANQYDIMNLKVTILFQLEVLMKKALSLLVAGATLMGVLWSCKSQTPNTTTTAVSDQSTPDGPATEIDETPMEEISYYQNPILTSNTKNAWANYGFGDPFVMRFNGMYYLYVSSKDGNTGILCWSSPDLVNWTFEGYCTREKVTTGAYAPEVYYYNGYFYMYTSPAGNGHYVLRSKSPTKGFEVITDNMGMSIDGSVFIDNNGKWYFYSAGSGAMRVYDMTSPSQMTNGRNLDAININGGWTEGPMVVYHDGYYYMTYTGNHVLSKSYRIYYGVSKKSPVSYSASAAKNPLLINTSDEVFGIGHNSIVKGPDLDSYYIVYHSLVNKTPNRNTNIDRIVFNGYSMEIMGPTVDKQQVPSLPDVYNRFGAGASLEGWTINGSLGSTGTGLSLGAASSILSDYRFVGDYTAEYNVSSIATGAKAGALFSYTDSENYGAFYFDPDFQKVIIVMTVNGESTVKEVKMVQSFKEKVKFDCIQTIQIERSGNDYTFYMNDHELCVIRDSALQSGSIGYITLGGEASFGFIGGTGAVGGRGAADEYKSVSQLNGLIPANTYTTGHFETETKANLISVVAKEGNVLNYRILAAETAYYDLAAQYYTGDAGQSAVMEVYVDGAFACTVDLTASAKRVTAIQRGIPLTEGQHTLSFKLISGNANFIDFTMLENKAVDSLTVNFSKINDGNVYADGSWRIKDGVLSIAGNPSSGKRLYGDRNWGDYTVEVEVTPNSGVNCGLLVRATNPGAPNFMNNPPSDDEANSGTDWVEGYYVGLTGNSVLLGKQSYSYDALKSGSGSFKTGTTYQLKVVCQGANIKVYVDGKLYIDYTDSDPFMQGMVGVRTYQCSATFDNFTVTAN